MYLSGEEVLLGDKVKLNDDEVGEIVALIESGQFDETLHASEWSHLKLGALVRSEKYGLFHYLEMNDEVDFTSRKDGT